MSASVSVRVHQRLGRLHSSTTALVVAVVLVHVWLGVYDLVIEPDAMHDVYGVYRRWMRAAAAGQIVGLDQPWVYPVAALLPIVVAYLPGDALFPVSWVVLVTLLDLGAVAALVRWGGDRGRAGAWWFAGFLLAVGPVAIGRLDGVAVPIAIVAVILLVRRPIVAGALLALATWIKVWPVAIVLAAVVAGRARWRIVAGGVAASVVIVGTAIALGGAAQLTSFLGAQGGRGLQVESVAALPFLWADALGAGDGHVYFDRGILTFQVDGTGTGMVARSLDPLLALVVVLVLALAVAAMVRTRDSRIIFPAALVGLTAALVVCDKVLSPQYLTWFAPALVAIGLSGDDVRQRWRAMVRMMVAAAILTQLVYPYLYFLLLRLNPALLAVITVRDVLLVALLVQAVLTLARSAVLPLPGLAPPRRVDRAP